MIEIRLEAPQDQNAIHHLNLAAFENGPEAGLVDALRSSCEEYLAFVAVEDGAVGPARCCGRSPERRAFILASL